MVGWDPVQKGPVMADIIINKEIIAEQMGDKAEEFIECIRIVQDIIENPDHYVGMQAVKYANTLAAYRTLMIVKSQAFKRKSAVMNDTDKFVNDIWKTMYEALTENINALKIAGKGGYSQ
jgi:hypothetical protein